MTGPERRAAAAERAGCVSLTRSRATGTIVGIYRAADAHLDTEGGPWATVCEDHGTIVNHDTLAMARRHAPRPDGWCEDCRASNDDT